jgi:hypothetical protein
MKSEEIKEHICRAFGSEQCPDPGAIVYDPSGTHAEAGQVMRFFGGKHWRQIDSAAIKSYDDFADASACLSFMSAAGFKHYLPAFMIFALEEGDDAGLIGASTVTGLAPWFDTSDRQMVASREQRFATFSDEQRCAIRNFLRFLQQGTGDWIGSADLDRALDYWIR